MTIVILKVQRFQISADPPSFSPEFGRQSEFSNVFAGGTVFCQNRHMVYDRLAERYDRLMAPLERRFLMRWRAEALASLPSDSIILEIGAGTGANFRFYPKSDLAVATEPAAGMIDLASSRANSQILVQTNAESLPFPDATFDAAFATLVLCSVSKPETALSELRRVVKEGGTVVLLEHVRPPGVLGYFFDAVNLITTALIEDCFNRRTSELVRSAGFEVVEIREKALRAVNLIRCRRPAD